MAIRMCKECGKHVSSKAKTCPNCGAPARESHRFLKLLSVVVLLVIFGGLVRNLVREHSADKRTDRPTYVPGKTIEKEAGNASTAPEKITMPKHTVLDEDVYDAPIKTQVELHILVSGDISEAGLRALLNNLYSSTKTKGGFKHHKSPTNIYIYAFTSKERAESGMGQWIAMLQESPGDIKPRISINKRQIVQLGVGSEERFGLSESQRIEIWKEYVLAEDRAWEKAEGCYPFDPGLSQSQFQKQAEKLTKFKQQLEKQYKGELAKKYGLPLEQLKEIADEGVTKDWPLPK